MDVYSLVNHNQLILGLLLSAFVSAAPENLPTIRQTPQWLYSYFVSALKLFVNMRHPQTPSDKR